MTKPIPGTPVRQDGRASSFVDNNQELSRTGDIRLIGTRPVLFVHHANDMYGADVGLLHSVTALDPKRFHPIVLIPADMPQGMLTLELDRLGIEYNVVPLGIVRRKYLAPRRFLEMVRDFVRGVIFVRNVVRKREVAIVYVNTFAALAGALGGRLARVPVLWHIREILYMGRSVRWLFHRALDSCADTVVCTSRAVMENLLTDSPRLMNRIVVVYNGVRVDAKRDAASPTLREQLNISDSATLVGMVGRLIHWKGQEVFARSAALLLRDYPDLHFVAIGSYFADETHYLRNLLQLVDQLGLRERFHLPGYRSDVGLLYRELDIFVLPSTKPEPFGRVTVEAMMQARPVIATNHGGSPELIQHEETGLLVPPSDPSALAAAITRLLTDSCLRANLGNAAACYAAEHFSLTTYQERIREIVEEMTAAALAVAG